MQNLQPKKSWKELVQVQKDLGKLKGATCALYSTKQEADVNQNELCVCGRSKSRHSFTGEPQTRFRNAEKWISKLSREAPLTGYGQIDNGARFIRCDTEGKTFETLVQILIDDVGPQPKLLVSCYGGAEYFTMTDELEREFMSGIGQVATTPDVWILTTGLNSGVSQLIGQGVHRSTLLIDSKWKPVVIGMSRWGTIAENTRDQLEPKKQSEQSTTTQPTMSLLDESQTNTLDSYHTHFLLFDNGCLNHYLDDNPRSKFVKTISEKTSCHTVTIIVEGGQNTLEVIQHDLDAHRPVVIIHGSGRLASVLGNLLLIAGKKDSINEDIVEQQLKQFPALVTSDENHRKVLIQSIAKVLHIDFRKYLSMFQLDRDVSLTNTIFRAVFDAQPEKRDNDEKLLDLAVSWNCIDGAHDVFKQIQASKNARSKDIEADESRKYYPNLFKKALEQNRPQFVDYFLRRYYNPLETTAFVQYRDKVKKSKSDRSSSIKSNEEQEKCMTYGLDFIIRILYQSNKKAPTKKHPCPSTLTELDQTYLKLIGPYAESFYKKVTTCKRFRTGLLSLCSPSKWIRRLLPKSNRVEDADEMQSVRVTGPESSSSQTYQISKKDFDSDKTYGKQEMLRDIFLWSVYRGHIDIAFVLLLQLNSRISAALVAAGMAHRLSTMGHNPHIRSTYKEHRAAYEKYATACIDACYKYNERQACQLLLREVPLFGNITCVQAAVSSRSIPFINTNCFNQVLNQQWYDHLDGTSIATFWGVCKFTAHLASFGLIAYCLLDYRSIDNSKEKIQPADENSERNNANAPKKENDDTSKNAKQADDEDIGRGLQGIDSTPNKKTGYKDRLLQFHGSPVVMVSYQFLVYIWFLLVFSYLMLFHMKSPHDSVHWTEIYVIITVSAALIEDIRKAIVEFHTQMLERWHKGDSWILIMYASPYILFYIGIGLHFGSRNRPDLFTAARIVLALDLEIWYLFSLRFVSAVKLLGPKLFMMRNMMRDLFGVIYIIFVCIAAYGVVSRALIMYSSMEFTANNISAAVFYRPYWFLYSVVEDEKETLDNIISSDTSTDNQKTEATVNHILLAFHMLFINILLLSLLIAMFNYSINDVQALNKYFWRYQRYELIREYFEKPMLAYPPLSLLVYIWVLLKLAHRRRTRYRIFKHLATPELDKHWTNFESAATYEHARALVEEKYRPHPKTKEAQEAIDELQARTKKLMVGMEWMMRAMDRVKMSAKRLPPSEVQENSNQ